MIGYNEKTGKSAGLINKEKYEGGVCNGNL